jgi:hypothetical protein
MFESTLETLLINVWFDQFILDVGFKYTTSSEGKIQLWLYTGGKKRQIENIKNVMIFFIGVGLKFIILWI